MSKGYSSGMRDKRIQILSRKAATVGKFGVDSSGVEWQAVATVWAAVDWVKGMRAMNEGAIDVYGVVLVRMNYTEKINIRSRIVFEGITYQILPETYHPDRRQNTIQFNAQAIVNDK